MDRLVPQPTPKSLSALLEPLAVPFSGSDCVVNAIAYDHRKVSSGSLFAALPGAKAHGIQYAELAIAAGAVAILTDAEGAAFLGETQVAVIVHEQPRLFMGRLAAEFFDHPERNLLTVGVTGTNGKTTTTHLIEATLLAAGKNPLMVGTVGLRFEGDSFPLARTTPEAPDLYGWMKAAVELGAQSLVMEVSSQGLDLGRVEGINFDVVVFTGLTQDHLDYHQTMENYFEAKAQLFTKERAKSAVICVDSEWGLRLQEQVLLPLSTYSVSAEADWQPKSVETSADGQLDYLASHRSGMEIPVRLGLPGDFNVANSLASLAVAAFLKFDLAQAAASLAKVRVPGRLERIDGGQDFVVLVDYAHTPDAVERALEVARTCASGRVIAVLGCGGDRDREKRGPMGLAAANNADLVLVTDDNPRSEDPISIRAAVLAGAELGKGESKEVPSRLEAIHQACLVAQPGDCVVILGKGHESGQEVAGVITPFDDRQVAAEAIASVMG